MSQKSLQNYIPALTGVRALAAYLVFISHYEYAFDENFPQLVKRYLQEFHIGVTIFFVLSGFLIAFRYYNNFHLTKGWFKQYLKNRVARIYPMYFLLTIGAFVYYYFTGDKTITAGFPYPFTLLLMNITFVRGFFDSLRFTGIAQGWSLTVEECFYFSAPFIFLIAKKYNKFYIQPLLITGFGALLVLIFRNVDWYGFFGNFTFMMVYTFLGRCFEFFVGIQLALLVHKRGLQRTNKVPFTYIGFILVLLCPLAMAMLPIPKGWTAGLHHPLGIITNNYILATSIVLFFYGLLSETTILKKILSNKFVELLGKSSYIFYLIHLGYMYHYIHEGMNTLNDKVFEWYDKWGVDWHSPFEYDNLNLLYAFIVLNAISILLFKTIEEPLNHYIRKSDFLIKSRKA
ncbi:acyltransferase [Mucilaginibacter sp. RS28]|uniref:Acyltransferase n=1 Tax=Mucilaginibacter straminoryzae TaxID=2932774 RepID=A0A9X2BEX4_9SPHI|nr:acyltransferase [Mucilaginibacter straminoryzae]MCJ8211893.1 acyltransferase [Mucilaginibacter straminoryzae]